MLDLTVTAVPNSGTSFRGLIEGDDDGVVVVRPEDAPSVLEKAKAMFLNEQKKMKSIEDGTMDKSWVDKALKAKGCEYIY